MTRQRLLALFVLGVLFFTFPFLDLFNRPLWVGSVPLLYVYLFGAWGLLVLLLRYVVTQAPTGRDG
ncbi:MAG: hypothetical protein AAGI71_08275 [Bacteroidota bacterium]